MGLVRNIVTFILERVGVNRGAHLKLFSVYKKHPIFLLKMLCVSRSQIGQDVFVACQLELWKKTNLPWYFVEFGATDGVNLSNTYVLERLFKWDGLLIEPARVWKSDLIANRKANIDFRCVHNVSGLQIEFVETIDPVYSTIQNYSEIDQHASKRMHGRGYSVTTVSLNDALSEAGAPSVIDYLSIDTEVSEYLILEAVDFNRWTFKVITVEHNFMPQRKLIYELLTNQGYTRVLDEISQMDDWYIKC